MFKNIILIFFLAAGGYLLIADVSAQSAPEFLVSWRAINYVPPSYLGKIFPSRNSPVEVGFDLLDKNKIIDLSGNEIQWFLDGELLKYGKGLKTIFFNSQGINHKIRITVFDYKGAKLDKIITIPGTSPKVVINARTPDDNIGLGTHVFEALPYFFNVAGLGDLSFSWASNNQPMEGLAEYPQFFTLNLESAGSIPIETGLTISTTVRNIFNRSELGTKKINLTIK